MRRARRARSGLRSVRALRLALARARRCRRLPRQADQLRPPRARRPRHDRAGAPPDRRDPRRHAAVDDRGARERHAPVQPGAVRRRARRREMERAGVALRYELSPIHVVSKIEFAGRFQAPGIDTGELRRKLVDRYGTSPPLGRVDQLSLADCRRAARTRVSASASESPGRRRCRFGACRARVHYRSRTAHDARRDRPSSARR